MNRKLIINGNEVYEIDEDCMLKRRLRTEGQYDGKSGQDRTINKSGEEQQPRKGRE